MPKLKAKTAILRVIDSHTYKDGTTFGNMREKCLSWGIPSVEIEDAIQEMMLRDEIEEPVIGYFKRKVNI